MIIVIAINNLMQIAQPAYANHSQFWYRLGKTMPEHQFIFFNPQRMSIDNMRNEAARIAIEAEADYLIFLDDDVLVPMDGLEKLISSDFSITAGVTLIRGYPYYPMLFDFHTDPECHYIVNWKERYGDFNGIGPENYDANVSAPCCAVGFSFCAISVETLKAVSKPYFMTGPNFTEDVFFCQKVNRELGEGFIGYRKDVETAHILGLDVITPEIRKHRIAFDEACDPDLKKKKDAVDRGEDYYKMIAGLVNANEA